MIGRRITKQARHGTILFQVGVLVRFIPNHLCPVKVQGILRFCFWRASIAACRDAPRRVVRDENDEKRLSVISQLLHFSRGTRKRLGKGAARRRAPR